MAAVSYTEDPGTEVNVALGARTAELDKTSLILTVGSKLTDSDGWNYGARLCRIAFTPQGLFDFATAALALFRDQA